MWLSAPNVSSVRTLFFYVKPIGAYERKGPVMWRLTGRRLPQPNSKQVSGISY